MIVNYFYERGFRRFAHCPNSNILDNFAFTGNICDHGGTMKKDQLILVVFLAIIFISGGAIFILKSPRADIATRPEGFTRKMDFQTEFRTRIANLESGLVRDPGNLDILIDLGNTYYDISDPAKAVEYYEMALTIKPDNAPVLVDCGSMYKELRQPQKAIELFNRAIEADPNFPLAYFNLGTVLRMEMGDAAGAARAWSKYLELEPNIDPQVKNLLLGEIEAASGS